MALHIELPYPDRKLSPNAQKRAWYNREAARKVAYDAGVVAAWATGKKLGPGNYRMTVIFHPPDARRRDLDNLLASMKPAIDGICKGLGIDDRQIYRIELGWGDVRRGGIVRIALEEA